MVVQLCEEISAGHEVFMDNLYCSLETVQKVSENNVYVIGTARKNRGVPASTELNEATAVQGDFRFAMANLSDSVNVVAGHWMDSGIVRFMSSTHDAKKSEVDRWVKGKKERQIIAAPDCMKDYNLYMHGNDRADQKRISYTVSQRTCKWWKAIFHWIIDQGLINAHLLYRKHFRSEIPRKDFVLTLCRLFCGIPESGRRPVDVLPVDLLPSRTAKTLKGLGGVMIGNHFLSKSKNNVNIDDRPTTKGVCFVCKELGRKNVDIRCDFFCIGCRRFVHDDCYQIFHLKRSICLVGNSVVGT
jgi:hypothetical protein